MRKPLFFLVLSLIVGASFFLDGCMMWMHGMDHGGMEHGQSPARTVVKELSSADTILTFDVPSLAAGKEAALLLRAERIKDGAPIAGARVHFIIERLGSGRAGVEREASETQRGVYRSAYRFEEHGSYRITVRFSAAEQAEAAAPLTLTVIGDAVEHEGRKDTTLWMVLGGIGMAAMMVLVML